MAAYGRIKRKDGKASECEIKNLTSSGIGSFPPSSMTTFSILLFLTRLTEAIAKGFDITSPDTSRVSAQITMHLGIKALHLFKT